MMAKPRKAPSIPKKVRRILSADQSLDRYFRHLNAYINECMHRRWKLAQIVQKRDNNVDVLMQIRKIHETPDGIYIEVR